MDHERKEIENHENLSEEESLSESQVSEKKRKKRHPFRWLFLIFLAAAGALYIQQWYLDLEAEAIIYAQQTASAVETATAQLEMGKLISATNTPTLVPPTATDDPAMLYTQTVAAQLTNVAEFQQTPTGD
jgi:hypothetical protein